MDSSGLEQCLEKHKIRTWHSDMDYSDFRPFVHGCFTYDTLDNETPSYKQRVVSKVKKLVVDNFYSSLAQLPNI